MGQFVSLPSRNLSILTDIVPGDCGSWVVDLRTGTLYGHIVAGDPGSSLAYFIPATQVFDEINTVYSGTASLLSREACERIEKNQSALTGLHPHQDLFELWHSIYATDTFESPAPFMFSSMNTEGFNVSARTALGHYFSDMKVVHGLDDTETRSNSSALSTSTVPTSITELSDGSSPNQKPFVSFDARGSINPDMSTGSMSWEQRAVQGGGLATIYEEQCVARCSSRGLLTPPEKERTFWPTHKHGCLTCHCRRVKACSHQTVFLAELILSSARHAWYANIA